jgi:3-hydroxyacyl-CoA dehydrogenase/enoyl-CoA hydratase/3-hydroxybutyryl-CoA epimerase
VLRTPARLVGIHFFNPVAQMQLVEVVTGPTTDADAAARALGFVTAIDRLPLPVGSAPGFLVNRVLSPYLQEAMLLLEDGYAPADIDGAARDFGMPMGPLELADTVGLDICLHTGQILGAAFGGQVPQVLRTKVERRELGRKTGAGFYQYDGDRPRRGQAADPGADRPALADRMLLRLLNEAVASLREGVVADPDLVDVGMVFGTGFAPFRGGPLAYARTRGVAEVTAELAALAARLGPRFTPDPGWSTLADAPAVTT